MELLTLLRTIAPEFEDLEDTTLQTWLDLTQPLVSKSAFGAAYNLNGIQIVSCAELNSTATDTNPYAAKTDGKGVALLYTKDQDKLSIEVPMPFYQHPAQNRNLEVVIPCESRVVGAMIYYPLSAIIAVGV